MKRIAMIPFRNGESVGMAKLPSLPMSRFRDQILTAVAEGQRVAALFGMRTGRRTVRLHAVLADNQNGLLNGLCTGVKDVFPSMTPDCPQLHLFEREIHEQFGVVPEGHPWLKPVRFAPADYPGAVTIAAPPIGETDFFAMHGDEIHEVAVGPVHAGVIEPGHFRFQCHGEHVYHLEISLGYQHRGIEKELAGGPHPRTVYQMETAAGDTSIGHTLAYAMALESLGGMRVPARAQAIRGIALELERLANHIGDLGALAGDVGFLPTSAQCGAIRGDFLNMTALLCGSRLGRGLVRPGGTRFDLNPERINELARRMSKGSADVTRAVNLLWDSSSVLSRFETTGTITRQQAIDLGLVGPAARAAGLSRDVRQDFPSSIYSLFHIPVSTMETGDVYSRAFVRWLEIGRSIEFIRELLDSLPSGETRGQCPSPLAADRFVVTLTEGWRGEICHAAFTDARGRLSRYKIVDPSFHNWPALALCLRGQEISDFPLCNKSFNLSYCGFDL
jgi:Ni,Fe-hydrogenase III large subunit